MGRRGVRRTAPPVAPSRPSWPLRRGGFHPIILRMKGIEVNSQGEAKRRRCFFWLLLALVLLLVSYPHFQDTAMGAFLGGLMSLIVLVAGVYAVRTQRFTLLGAGLLALAAATSSVVALATGSRGHPVVEGIFTLFYAFLTIAVFVEVMRRRAVRGDNLFGIICVYLLIGVTFGTLYDFVETVSPGSFGYAADSGVGSLGWRQLIFFSFMTLTGIGYGDITPMTSQAQSLAIIEGVTGVLYVAVLIARIVGTYSRRAD